MKIFCLLVFLYLWVDVNGARTKRNVDFRGGTPKNITQAPFMAIFRGSGNTWGCGASIVHERFLVTAAHCSTMISNPEVIVGTDNIRHEGTNYEIENVFVHPKFDTISGDYDIAVVKLKNKLEWSERVAPIELSDAEPKDGDIVETMGFGNTEHGHPSAILLHVKLPVVNRKKCSEELKAKITDRMICAGGEKGKDGCQGDSGGPLWYQGKLLGAVSWGSPKYGCGQLNRPGVYASVPALRDFVEDIIKNNSFNIILF